MLSPSAAPARLPGYNLSPPSEADARAALERVFGPERAVERWRQACHDASLEPGRVETRAQMERAAGALAQQGGPCVALARSLEIRMRTYDRLAANAAPAGGAR